MVIVLMVIFAVGQIVSVQAASDNGVIEVDWKSRYDNRRHSVTRLFLDQKSTDNVCFKSDFKERCRFIEDMYSLQASPEYENQKKWAYMYGVMCTALKKIVREFVAERQELFEQKRLLALLAGPQSPALKVLTNSSSMHFGESDDIVR